MASSYDAQQSQGTVKMDGREIGTVLQCNEAIAHVKKKVSSGAANRPRFSMSYFDAKIRVGALRSHQGTRVTNGPINRAWITGVAVGAETAEAGNCGEQSAVAFAYLLNKGVRPLDYMYRTNGDHAFVVVGRRAGTDATNPATWGAAAYVCDPWHGSVFHATVAELHRRGWKVDSAFREE